MAAAQELRRAVVTLYRGTTQERSMANGFLAGVQTHEAAWAAALELVRTDEDETVRFFCANLLYGKIRRERLPLESRTELAGQLLEVVATAPRQVAERCATAVAALAVQSASFEWALSGSALVLKALATEMLASDLSRQVKLEFQHGIGLQIANTLEAHSFDFDTLEALKAIYEVIDRTELSSQFLQRVCVLLSPQTEKEWRLAAQALTLIAETLARRATNGLPPAAETGPFLDLLRQMNGLVDISRQLTLERHQLEASAAETTLAISKVAAALSHPSGLGVALSRTLSLWEVALKCTSHPRRSVALPVLDAWLDLQDIPLDARHPDLTQPTFRHLLDVLVTQCRQGAAYDEDDDDAALAFRDLSTDVLIATFISLDREFPELLTSRLRRALESHDLSDADATLFALAAPSKTICDDGGSGDAVLLGIKTILEYLEQRQPREILKTSARFIGSYAILLKGDLLGRSLRVLCGALAFGGDIAVASGRAFRGLCVSSPATAWRYRDVLQAAHHTAVRLDDDLNWVVEGVARVVAASSAGTTEEKLRIAYEPSFEALKAAETDVQVSRALTLLETAARFTTGLRRPLAQAAWPLLEHLCQASQNDEIVANSAEIKYYFGAVAT